MLYEKRLEKTDRFTVNRVEINFDLQKNRIQEKGLE